MVSPGSRPYNRAYIQSDKFDTLEFIRITRSLPFGSLNICLNQHLDEVKEELGQLVNNEFSQFISLYGQIGETGNQELAALSESLVTLHGKIGGLVKEVNEEHSQFKSAMEELKETQRTEVIVLLIVSSLLMFRYYCGWKAILLIVWKRWKNSMKPMTGACVLFT